MGFGRINIWIRDRKTCGVAATVTGDVTIAQCCGKVILEDKISQGHADLTVPPGCYIITAHLRKSLATYETMVIVNCDKSACINFLFVTARED
jgi:hypothetical protein